MIVRRRDAVHIISRFSVCTLFWNMKQKKVLGFLMCSAAAAVLSKAKEKVLQVVSVSYSNTFGLSAV